MGPIDNTQYSLANALLQALPHPAMLINQSREILAANKLAVEAGAVVGQFCWKTFGNAAFLSDEHQQFLLENPELTGAHCTFCRGDASLENMHEENDPNVNALGSILDTYWVAINKEIFLHYAIDVTEQVETQAAKNEAERTIRLILDSVAEGIYGIDRFGNCTFSNQRCLDLLGYQSEEELLGRNMHELIHHSRQDGTALSVKDCRISQIFESGEPRADNDTVFWKADDTSFPVECWSRPMERDGEVVGAVVTFLDISDRKKLFEEYRRSTQLAVLGTVAAGVAHEINNPIQGILNYATLLRNKPDQVDRTIDISERIIRESERITEITRTLLDFARDDHNKMATTDICPLIASALDLIEKKIIRQGISIEKSCPTGLPKVLLYPQGIQQIVINLIENASYALQNKEMPITEKVIKVSCYVIEKDDSQMMCLEVADRGIGMTVDVLERARETFFSTKPSSKGTGLGLSIVTDIINRHNGSMDIESDAGEYTKVKIYIPMATDQLYASLPEAV